MIPSKVHRDAVKPCLHRTLPAEAGPAGISLQKTFLRQRVGSIGIAQQRDQQAVDTPLVQRDELVEVLGGESLRRGEFSDHAQVCQSVCHQYLRAV